MKGEDGSVRKSMMVVLEERRVVDWLCMTVRVWGDEEIFSGNPPVKMNQGSLCVRGGDIRDKKIFQTCMCICGSKVFVVCDTQMHWQ